ncbi:MAG TPA: flagellar hook-associated protein FlgL [Polyangiaceae bacterium]|jgi:flagellar hook-associated protein 3 FlgL|nr:flagellar hook-associated protein FlgL [Polyangiaceae bacterium]
MRISEGMRYDMVGRSLSDLSTRQAEVAQQASSGQRVANPSDDPIAAAELTRLSAAQAHTTQYQKASSAVRGDATIAEGVLGEAGDSFARLREIALQGANDTMSADERTSLADEVKTIKSHMVGLANTKGSNGYLFAGTETDSAPFDSTGTFSGNDDAHLVEVSQGVSVRANPSGSAAFTAAGGTDVFATIDALETGLRSNSTTAISATLDQVEAARSQVTDARAQSGLLIDRLDTTDAALSQAQTTLGTRTVAVGQADPYQTYSDLTRLNNALQQAVAVARTTLTPGGQVG